MPTAALGQDSSGLETVVVTATKRPTLLLDTPMNITVINSATLAATNADDFDDFSKLVPGLSDTDAGPGNKRYALRGLQSAGEPEVALYYDEIPIAGLPGGSLDTGDSQPDLKLWDVDRIEVLRGPQGTLYGNGSMGGAIRIMSKRPELDTFDTAFQSSVAGTQGGSPSGGLSGMVNVPVISDKLAFRLAVYYRYEGGWIDDQPQSNIALPQIDQNNINWERTWGGRASMSYQPSPQWNITGIAYYQDMHTGNAFETYPSFATSGDQYVSKQFVRTPWQDNSQMYNIISTYDLGWASEVTTGSFQRRTLDRNLDTTRFLLSMFGCTEFTWNKTCFGPSLVPADSEDTESVDSWSGETRLTSQGTGPLQWTVGAFLQDSETNRRGQVASTGANGYLQFDSAGNALNRLFARNNQDTFDQYAFFGEGSYEVVKDLTATVGLRWFDSDRTDQQVVVQQFFPGQPLGAEPFQEFKQSDLFKKFELSYKLDSGLVYAQAAQGFRAGGPNYPGGFNVTAPAYGSDSVWDYELGGKFNLDGSRIFISGDVFDIEWNNLQELVPSSLFSYIVNGGKARSQGFESELNYVPVDGLTLAAGLTYNYAQLVGPQPAGTNPTVQLVAGDRLANAPNWTANGSISYLIPLDDGFNFSARLDGNYQSSRGDMVATQNPAYFVIKQYALFDLHLKLDRGANWSVGLDVTNLANSFAELSGRPEDSNLINTVTPARPRTIGINLKLTQ
jgi:iron complex outermembrane receptor protein